MTESSTITLEADQRERIVTILRTHLPDQSRAYVFGSRATGRAKRYSDLDLAIETDNRLTANQLSALAEAFRASDLPWKVDLVEINTLEPWFRRIVEPQFLRLL